MKKLVLVVAMFMFVCGGSFLVKAQNSAEAATALTEVNATVIVNDTVVKDTVTKSEEPVKDRTECTDRYCQRYSRY